MTDDPILAAYYLAQHINTAAGGAVIAPWQVGGLTDEWIIGAVTLTTLNKQKSKLASAQERIDARMAQIRNSHPAMRKRN